MANAIAETYQRKSAHEGAKAKKEETIVLWTALQDARGAQLKAENAFTEPIRIHACKKECGRALRPSQAARILGGTPARCAATQSLSRGTP
jgi:hypothetical protein